MKNYLVIILLIAVANLSMGQEKILPDSNYKKRVLQEFKDNYSKCSPSKIVKGISFLHKKQELWSVCKLDTGNRIITIESYKKETYYQEIYFEVNRKLRYAKETEDYMPKNSFTQMPWNVEYFFIKGELVDIISLGHGKTENPSWNPDFIISMYKNRIVEYNKIIKNSK